MSSSARILIVDDENSIRRFLNATLTAHGYLVYEATNGEEALFSARQNRFELVILDLGLPDMDGVEVIRQLRQWSDVPVIILSVRERESDKVSALDAGADDYLTKPFGVNELLARLRVALRRAGQEAVPALFEVGSLRVDSAHRLVTINGEEISLTPTEYDILSTLVHFAGKVITHAQLIRLVWGQSYESDNHILRVNISNLRKKIEVDPSQPEYILTEPGVGYRLKVEG